MPINRERIAEILRLERANLTSLSMSFRGWIGYSSRLLYDQLRADGREDLIHQELDVIREASPAARALADNVAIIREHYAEISALAAYELPVSEDSPIFTMNAIDLKSDELSFLSAARDAVAFAASLSTAIESAMRVARSHMSELEEMLEIPLPPQLFRIHVAHLWYANYQIGKTPTPFLMSSCFVYTTRPEDWRFDTLNSALIALETEELSIRFAKSGFRVRKDKTDNRATRIVSRLRELGRPVAGGAKIGRYQRVIGAEAEKVDWDEIFGVPVAGRIVKDDKITYLDADVNEIKPALEITEDTILYYLLFYKISGGVSRPSGSYFGRVIPLPAGYRFELLSPSETPWAKGEFVAELEGASTAFDSERGEWR